MSDDIDIEEHDVLDNPRIRKIFAGMVDISAIKEEAPDIEDEPMEYEYASEEFLQSECPADDFDDPEVEYPVHNNKIILGSKPSKENEESLHTEGYHNGETALVERKSIHLSLNTLHIEEVRSESEASSTQDDGHEDIEESQDFEEDEYNVESEGYSYNSVVILGSKPNTNKLKLKAVVALEDWGPRLENSPCYCKECEILFATRNVLDAHKMTAHSFLVALDESNISKNTARKSTGLDTYSRGTLCNHCNKRFTDDTLLIKHLYENLTSGSSKCDECSAVFNNPADLKAHARTHVKTVSLNASTSENIYYQCFVCGIFTHMKYVELHKRHMLKNHCITEPNMTLVAFNPNCRFCTSVISSTSNFKMHIKMKHTKKFLQKPIKSEKVKTESKMHKYQCLICNEVFLIYQSARNHRIEKHPESKGTKLFNKITYRKNAVSVNFKKITAVSKPVTVQPQGPTTKNSLPLVPRKVLFKCNQCQIHFTNYAAAIVHSRYCLKYKGSWKCQKCRRSFKMEDRKHHLRQHEFTDTFDVYTTNVTLCKRVLSKCPQCKLYLHEQNFWQHYQSQCKTKEGYSCLQCKAIIQQSSVEFHKQLHNIDGYSDDDMIWIEYVKVPVETPAVPDVLTNVKVESNTGVVESFETNKKKPGGYKLVMSYCQNCKCCMIIKKNLQAHLTGTCATESVKKYRTICKTCGLKFLCHKKCPIRIKGIKLDDIKFVRLRDNKIINPPIPKYNRCKKCGINGNRRMKIDKHVCNGVKKTCKYCKEEFSDAAYKPHIALHEYRNPKKNAVIEMPELLKKYEMLTQSWNLLYSCDTCKIVTDSYDKAVDHAQCHYSSLTKVELKKCQTCKLKFDSKCFVRHRELHSGDADIHKGSFKVLSYDYKLLLTDDWLGMFKSLPDVQVQLIVNNSIYRYTRKLKMEVEKNGAPNLTLYKCCKCCKYLVPCNVLKHYTHAACCKTDTGYQCPSCSLTFEDEKNCKIHAAIHKCISRQNFRTVVFNQKDDKHINDAIRAAAGETVEYKHHYYKCKSCEYCVLNKNAANHHVCNLTVKRYCSKCKIYMSKYSARDHSNTHRNYPKFSRKDIKFYWFTPSNSKGEDNTTEDESSDDSEPHKEKPEKGKQKVKPGEMKPAERSILKRLLDTDDVPMKKKVNLAKEQQCSSKDETHAILMKCACGLHFTSSTAAEAHARSCRPGSKESSDDCSKCGRLFDTSELFKHLCKHHSNNKNVTFSVIPVPSIDKEDEESDSTKDETESNGESEDTAPPTENKRIVNMKRLLTKNAEKYKAIAYKCKCCSTHFMSEITRRIHMKKMAVRPFNSAVKACEDCGLVFIKTSLDMHKYIHHTTMNLSRKDIIVNGSGKAVNKKQSNKQESYQNQMSEQKSQVESEQVELYLCKGCNVHFMSKSGLNVHIKENSAPKTAACDECDLLFCKNALPMHQKHHHEQLNLTRDDIPINSSFKKKCIPKLSAEISAAAPMHTAFDLESKNVYRCDDCLVHFSSYSRLIIHLDKLVHEEITRKCYLCKHLFCLADFKRHKVINHVGSKTLEKFDVVGSKTLYKCAMCPAHFVREQRLDSHLRKNEHDCSTVYCPLCGLTFTNITLSFHKKIHHEAKIVIKDFRIIVKGNNKGNMTEKSKEKKKQFAPKKKYRKKCKLYKCSKCKTHFMKSETLSLHNHTTKVMQQRKNCPYCGLLFSPRTLARHMLVHHKKMKYKFEEFHIVMDTAIKKRSRKADEDTGDDNLENTSDELDNAIDDAGNLESTNIRSDSLTINIGNNVKVKIDPKKDKNIGNNAKEQGTAQKGIVPFRTNLKFGAVWSNIRCADGTIDSIKILYKCTECPLHFVTKQTLSCHICYTDHSSAKNIVHCPDCGLGFTKKSLNHHKLLHHTKNKLSLGDFKFATYLGKNPDSDTEEISTVDSAALDEDNTMESTESEVFQDLKKETESGEPDTSVQIGNYNNRLYKCDTCSIHFIDEDGLRIHKQNDTHAELKYDCTICDLAFDVTNIPNHIDIHHRKLGLKAQGFNIVSELSETMEVDTAEGTDDSIVSQSTTAASVAITPNRTVKDTKFKLYKCADCDVHFMAQATCYKHIVKHKRMDPEDYITCKICGLQFKIVSLNKHMNRHHKAESFKIEDVVIEEYHPDVLTNGAPTLNIYQASNKVQSRLVSTTTDKDVEVSEAS